MKLIALSKKLRSLQLHKEATQVLKLASGEVFAHISGPSGSGKTTVMEEISSLHPAIPAKDLDQFDEEATEEMGLDPDWKQNTWSEELQKEHYKIKQRLLDDFIEANAGKKILLVGLHEEGGDSLNFRAKHKILLDVDSEEAVRRRIKRDKALSSQHKFWKDPELMKSELEESDRVIEGLISEGYVKMSPEKILELFEDSTR